MNQEDTICHKVNRSIAEIEKAIKTGRFAAAEVAKNLHKIRQDATRMESGLKLRKKIMIEAGLEEKYQSEKIKEHTPPGINKVAGMPDRLVKEPIEYEVIFKQKDEVIYQNKVHAAVICTVEKVTDIDEFGAIEGTTQKFFFGHDLSIWFAYDQLTQGLEDKKIDILSAMRTAIQHRKFLDPQFKNKMLDLMNNKP